MLNHGISRRRAIQAFGGGAAAFGIAGIVGCGGDDDDDELPEGTSTAQDSADTRVTPAGTARAGGALRVAFSSDPTGLDPSVSRGGFDHNWLYSLFDNLVNNDPKFQVAPGIASEWEPIDDTTIRFKVDTGFTYHDGNQFSAEDIKYTIDRHLDPATKSYAAGQLTSIDSVEVVDPTTVVFHLKSITASIFAILGDRAGMVLNRKSVESAGAEFTNKPIGSGPMKLDSWTVDASTKLSRFANYRRAGYPYLDGVDIQIVPNSSVQFANLRTGNTDMIAVSEKDVAEAKKDSNIQFVEWVGTGYAQVNLNISQPPLNDIRIRQAMTYSLNRKAILEAIYFGVGELANGPLTAASWAYDPTFAPIEEDLKRARELMTAAGHEDGITFDFLITPGEENTPLAEILKAQWARVGLNVNIVPRSAEEAGAEFRAQKYPFFLTGFSGRADPDLTIFENFHSKGGFNRAAFNTAWVPEQSQVELDAKIVAARQTYDQEERKGLYKDIVRQIVENGHGIFFKHNMNLVGLAKNVHGFTSYGDGKYRLHEMWFDA